MTLARRFNAGSAVTHHPVALATIEKVRDSVVADATQFPIRGLVPALKGRAKVIMTLCVEERLMNIDDLRAYCLALPHATEDVQWGNDLLFRIGNKIFAATGLDTTPLQISLKCTPERFAELIEIDGIVPARYTARYHWVTVERTDALSRKELESLIKQSYEMVLAKLPSKFKKQIGA